jgi:hypothetical protein
MYLWRTVDGMSPGAPIRARAHGPGRVSVNRSNDLALSFRKRGLFRLVSNYAETTWEEVMQFTNASDSVVVILEVFAPHPTRVARQDQIPRGQTVQINLNAAECYVVAHVGDALLTIASLDRVPSDGTVVLNSNYELVSPISRPRSLD